MPQFQNYSQNQNMNMGMNNFNPYNPMQDFYANRMNQMQQQIQQSQQTQPMQMQNQSQGIIGKPVNDFSEITADDIPMNGTPAVFVKNDMSEIEVRVWGKDGIIRPTTYKPILEENATDGTNIPQIDFNGFMDDMRAFREDITSRFDKLEKTITPAKTTSRTKKEADA